MLQCKHGVPVGTRYHDCAYVDFRTRIVPEAEAFANQKAGPRPPSKRRKSGSAGRNEQYEQWAVVWNLFFHEYITNAVMKWMEARNART